MREKHRPDMGEEEAAGLMKECLKVGGCLLALLLTGAGAPTHDAAGGMRFMLSLPLMLLWGLPMA